MEAERDLMQARIESLQSQLFEVQEVASIRQQQLTQAQQVVKQLERDREKHQLEMKSVLTEHELANLEKERVHASQLAGLEEERLSLQREAKDERFRHEELEQKVQSTLTERDSLQIDLDNGQRRIRDLEMQLDRMQDAAGAAEQEIGREVTRVREELAVKTQRCATLEAQLEVMKSELTREWLDQDTRSSSEVEYARILDQLEAQMSNFQIFCQIFMPLVKLAQKNEIVCKKKEETGRGHLRRRRL